MPVYRRENGVSISGHTANGVPLGLKSGNAIIVSGNTSIVVSHNLGVAPRDISVAATDDYGADWLIETITSTQFTISIPVPQPTNAGFIWSVLP